MTTPQPSSPAPRRSTALFSILISIVIGGAILALLYYTAITSPQPSRVIVVHGDANWLEAKLRLEGDKLGEPQIGHFEPLGNYVVPFFIWPGKYTLHVIIDGEEVFTKQFDMNRERTSDVDLIALGATTHPSSQPATRAAQ